jgi:hypothetical protein
VCMTLEFAADRPREITASPAAVGIAEALARADRLSQPLPDPDSAAVWDELKAMNDKRDDPMPFCPSCRRLFCRTDGGWLLEQLCGTCELNRFEELITTLVYAKGRKAVKQALRNLKRLRELT